MSETQEDVYTAETFGRRIGFGVVPAVLVVDMIRAFADPKAPFGFDLAPVTRNIVDLLQVARTQAVPVIFSVTAYDDPESEAGVWLLKMPALRGLKATAGSTELVADLGRQAEEPIINKKYASAFFSTCLCSLLTARRIDTLVIVGCTTSGCIRASAVDAVQYGFRPIVVRECVGDRLAMAHEASLLDLDAKYCDVMSLRKAEDHLSQTGRGRIIRDTSQ